jgi:hypothetical protein
MPCAADRSKGELAHAFKEKPFTSAGKTMGIVFLKKSLRFMVNHIN